MFKKEGGLRKITALEKKYNWIEAAILYKKAVCAIGYKDCLKKGEIQEKVGYAFLRAARQAESANQFREIMHETIANYEKAKAFYECLNEPRKTPRMFRCDAMIAYVSYWLASEVHEKKRLIDDCWRQTKEALNGFKETGDKWEYGKTYNQLSTSAILRFFYDWNFETRNRTVREAAVYGEEAISARASWLIYLLFVQCVSSIFPSFI
jgi:hypothetical protein